MRRIVRTPPGRRPSSAAPPSGPRPRTGPAGRGRLWAALALLPLLGACALDPKSSFAWRQPNMNTYGPLPVVNRPGVEQLDLALLLDPESTPMASVTATGPAAEAEQQKILEKAYEKFYDNAETKGRNVEVERNRLQEKILLASDLRCGVYKDYLKRIDAETNLGLGAATTVSAGLGAIFTAANVVRAFSGAAAIFSGLRAEFNEQIFQQLTTQVMVNGIELRRERVYARILHDRAESIQGYPVERAIKDAVVYDDGCALVAGLEEAALAIQRARDPGLAQLRGLEEEYPGLASPRLVAPGNGGGALSPSGTLDALKTRRDQAKAARTTLAGLTVAAPKALSGTPPQPRQDERNRLARATAALDDERRQLIARIDAGLPKDEALTAEQRARLVKLEEALAAANSALAAATTAAERNVALANRNAALAQVQAAQGPLARQARTLRQQVGDAEALRRRIERHNEAVAAFDKG